MHLVKCTPPTNTGARLTLLVGLTMCTFREQVFYACLEMGLVTNTSSLLTILRLTLVRAITQCTVVLARVTDLQVLRISYTSVVKTVVCAAL